MDVSRFRDESVHVKKNSGLKSIGKMLMGGNCHIQFCFHSEKEAILKGKKKVLPWIYTFILIKILSRSIFGCTLDSHVNFSNVNQELYRNQHNIVV